MSRWLSALRGWLRVLQERRSPPYQEGESFEARCERLFDIESRIAFGVVALVILAWWPSDPFILGDFPEAMVHYARWRGVAIALGVAYVLAPRPRFVAGHTFWLFAGTVALACANTAYCMGRFAGPDLPHVHLLDVICFTTVTLPLELRRRALLTGAFALAFAAGYYLPFAAHRASPYMPLALSFLICSALASTAFGHILLRLSRDKFEQGLELAAHGRTLARRVAERTAELRRLLADLETAREDERARIARELHDELGQELLALRYAAAITGERYGREPLAIGANLRELRTLLERTNAIIRNILAELRPRVLDDLGLAAAVRWLVERTEQRGELRCRLRIEGDLSAVDPDVGVAGFRILQESLTNVAAHACASAVEVDLTIAAGALELRICDDGIGLDAAVARRASSPRQGGMGIIGMRERAESLGGELTIDGGPTGTRVRCLLPLRASAPSLERQA